MPASPAVSPPPGNPRFPLLDGVRGIAVLAVVAFHVTGFTGALVDQWWGKYAAVLSQGVMLFFVLSGFLMYRPFVAARAAGRPAPRLRDYVRRRALRIVPAYWLALTVLTIWPGLEGPFGSDWWAYYGFLQVYFPGTAAGGIPVAWSLCVEVAFYALVPLFAMAAARVALGPGTRGWVGGELALIVPFGLVGIAVQVAAQHGSVSDLLPLTLLGHTTFLAVGMALAVASVALEGRDSLARRVAVAYPGALWALAAAAYVGLALYLQYRIRPAGVAEPEAAAQAARAAPAGPSLADLVVNVVPVIGLVALIALALVLPAVFGGERRDGVPQRVLAFAPLAWIGVVSYGIYLWHVPLALVIASPPGPVQFVDAHGLGLVDDIPFAATPVLFCLVLAVTAAVAAASYHLVELRFLRLKDRRADRAAARRW